jgi:histidinol-phosphate phosphatase family protein
MKNKYIIFDRDGTLIKHVHYLTKIEDIEFLPGVIEGLAALTTNGYKFGIISNQSLIGRKIAKKATVDKINLHILDCLKWCNINIDFVYICPHMPSEECECRKPKIGLGIKAVSNFAINTALSYMIGDTMSDIQFGINLGLNTVQINPLDHVHSEADFVTNNMIFAAEWILRND